MAGAVPGCGAPREIRLISRDLFHRMYDAERERLMNLMVKRRSGNGGNYCNTVPFRIGRPFAQAVFLSIFEGRTPYRESYGFLQVREYATFQEVAACLEVS